MLIYPEQFGDESQFKQPTQAATFVRLHFSQASF